MKYFATLGRRVDTLLEPHSSLEFQKKKRKGPITFWLLFASKTRGQLRGIGVKLFLDNHVEICRTFQLESVFCQFIALS